MVSLEDLFVCGDSYKIKHDLTDIVPYQYKPCGKKCASCDNFVASQSYVISNATGRKYYIRWDSICSPPNVVYMAHCKKFKMQGAASTISWKPKLRNFKSHVKKNALSCKIATHYIDECCDEEIPFKYLTFAIIDVVNNTSGLTRKFWIGTLVTQHQGLNSTHDWNCSKRKERKKINN